MRLNGSRRIPEGIETASPTQTGNSSSQSIELIETADQFICRVLRGEQPGWPEADDSDFEQAFLQRLLHHGVEALVFDQMYRSEAWPGWPDHTREHLKDVVRAGAAFDLFRVHKVTGFLAELSSRDIPFLVIKGEALAQTHYPKASLRTRCDTDLFIHLGDIDAVQQALVSSGFEVIPPIYKTHQFTGVSGKGGGAAVVFDVHWRILNAARFARSISFTEAMEQSVTVPNMAGCRTLGVVDSLLLACMHRLGSTNHDADRLIWLYDIHLLVSAMTPGQLEAFVQKAASLHVQAACLDGLNQVKHNLRTNIPEEVLCQLGEDSIESSDPTRYSNSNLSLLIEDFRALPGFGSRWGLVQELMFPSPDSLLHKYGKSSRLWLPWLYVQQMVGGSVKRLSLK